MLRIGTHRHTLSGIGVEKAAAAAAATPTRYAYGLGIWGELDEVVVIRGCIVILVHLDRWGCQINKTNKTMTLVSLVFFGWKHRTLCF